jgi:hypothetical protein
MFLSIAITWLLSGCTGDCTESAEEIAMAKALTQDQLASLDKFMFEAQKNRDKSNPDIPLELQFLNPEFVEYEHYPRIGLKFCGFDAKIALEFSELEDSPRKIIVTTGEPDFINIELWSE